MKCLLTDPEGTSRLCERCSEAMQAAFLRPAVKSDGDHFMKSHGHEGHAIFESVSNGVNATGRRQQAMYA